MDGILNGVLGISAEEVRSMKQEIDLSLIKGKKRKNRYLIFYKSSP
jgi:hypothetical protein